MARDLTCSIVLAGIAALYYVLASDIGRSALADEIGPQGLPMAYAALLGAVAIALAAKVGLRSWLGGAWGGMREDQDARLAHQLRRAGGVLAIGIGYLLIVPVIGYLLALIMVIAAMALYQGERPTVRLALIAGLGATVFWLLFDRLLGIPMPGWWSL